MNKQNELNFDLWVKRVLEIMNAEDRDSCKSKVTTDSQVHQNQMETEPVKPIKKDKMVYILL